MPSTRPQVIDLAQQYPGAEEYGSVSLRNALRLPMYFPTFFVDKIVSKASCTVQAH